MLGEFLQETFRKSFFSDIAILTSVISRHHAYMEKSKNISFEGFELDRSEAELRKDGAIVKVEPQVFELLWYFGTNAGKLISKDDLILGVWNGRIVSDAAISTRINGARVAIDDNGTEQRLI